jgi:hypothetical protein
LDTRILDGETYYLVGEKGVERQRLQRPCHLVDSVADAVRSMIEFLRRAAMERVLERLEGSD